MKQILTLLYAMLLTTSVVAQTTTRWQPYVRVGAGASRAIGEQTSSPGALSSPNPYSLPTENAVPTKLGGNQWLLVGNVGAGITIPVSQHFSIRAEVNLEQKGSKVELTRATTDSRIMCDPGACPVYSITGSLSSRLTYLTLPVMASYEVGKINLSVGPYVGYKVAEQRHLDYTRGNNSFELNTPSNGFSNFDIGFVASIGYAVTSHVGVDLQYGQGLRYVARPYDNFGSQYTESFYNQTAQVGVRYNLVR